MKRMPFQWLGLTAAAAMLVAGCASPQRTPGNAPNQSSIFSTTGDADQCATALGNSVNAAGTRTWGRTANMTEATANGLILGNVALVALPANDGMRTTPPTDDTGAGGVGTGETGFRAGATPGPSGTAATPGATATTGATGTTPATGAANNARAGVTPTPGAPGAAATAPRTGIPDTGLGVPGTIDTTPNNVGTTTGGGTTTGAGTTTGWGRTGAGGARGANGVDGTRGATGAGTTVPNKGTGTAAGTRATGTADMNAVERVRTACPNVAEIRVVNSADDRATLARITAAVRSGQPVTQFMTELTNLSQRATVVGTGRAGVNGTNGTAPGTNGTAPGTNGTAPGAGTTPGTNRAGVGGTRNTAVPTPSMPGSR